MPTALTATMALKQDKTSRRKLAEFKASFTEKVQPAIEKALRESELVHFARVVVIDDKYIQVITEFDGDPITYTEFFRQKLPDVFKAIYGLSKGIPPWDEIDNQDAFFEVSRKTNVPPLGTATDGSGRPGWMFSYFGDKTVREIAEALGPDAGEADATEALIASPTPTA